MRYDAYVNVCIIEKFNRIQYYCYSKLLLGRITVYPKAQQRSYNFISWLTRKLNTTLHLLRPSIGLGQSLCILMMRKYLWDRQITWHVVVSFYRLCFRFLKGHYVLKRNTFEFGEFLCWIRLRLLLCFNEYSVISIDYCTDAQVVLRISFFYY